MNPFARPQDRRAEARHPANVRGLVTAPGLEAACAIIDVSPGGLRIRLERNLALPPLVVVVEAPTGLAHEAKVAWRDGHEAGLKRIAQSSVRGLVPQRLTAAREAWLRAGGR